MLACIPVSPAAAALFAPESDGFAVAVHSVEEVTAIRGVADLRFGGCVSVFRAADREMVDTLDGYHFGQAQGFW